MAENWLQNRLSPVKRDTDRWVELAQAIETFWQENFDGSSERLDSLKSIFLASRDDQLLILSELGKYYDIDLPDSNIPLAVIQRRMELFQKDTLVPLTESLKRACPGIRTEWRPLFARHDKDYSDREFYTQAELIRNGHESWLSNAPARLDGSWVVSSVTDVILDTHCYMISRGKVLIDESNIDNPETIESTIRERLTLILPLHIVFEGVIWYLSVELDVTNGDTKSNQIIKAYGNCPVFCCYLILDGTWNVNGSRFLCADNGDIRYQYPVTSESVIIASSDILVSLPTMFSTYLDGSLLLDGSWGLTPYPG